MASHSILANITLNIAEEALEKGDYPIGALIVDTDYKIVAQSGNRNATNNDITAHAEIQCLRTLGMADLSKGNGKTHYLYTSLEPCAGCAFFIARTNIKKVYAVAVDEFRAGLSRISKMKEYKEVFQEVGFTVINNDLTKKKSLGLMVKYFEKVGNNMTAGFYRDIINK